MPHHMDSRMRECIDRCRRCEESCLESVTHCLEKGGAHAQAGHITLMLACVEICGTSARFMLLGSQQHARTCEVCAEVCDACAKDCESLADDEMIRACADACRRCAESCRQMVGAAA